MDWREQLKAFAEANPDLPEGIEPEPEEEEKPKQGRLDIVLDRKGRAGKTATLVRGWTLPAEEVARIAGVLKQKLATGGSVSEGEILVQGDRRQKLLELLGGMGFKARII